VCVVHWRLLSEKANDWEARPLSRELLNYAAGDAAVLLDLHSALVQGDTNPLLHEALGGMAEHLDPIPAKQRAKLVHSSLHNRAQVTLSSSPPASAEGVPAQPTKGDGESRGEANLLAVFLEPGSRQLLLERLAERRHALSLPPGHPVAVADHVTLAFRPSTAQLVAAGGLLGRRVHLRVDLALVVRDGAVDAVPVALLGESGQAVAELVASGCPHLTLGKATAAQPARASLDLLAQQPLPTAAPATSSNGERGVASPCVFELVGMVGVRVVDATARRPGVQGGESVCAAAAAEHLGTVPLGVRRRVEGLAEGGQWGQVLRFKPGELTAAERRAVHLFAEACGIETRSEGSKDARRLVLKVPSHGCSKDTASDEGGVDEGSGRVVKNLAELDKAPHRAQQQQQQQQQERPVNETVAIVFSFKELCDRGIVDQSPKCESQQSTAHGQILTSGVQFFQNDGDLIGDVAPALRCLHSLLSGEDTSEKRVCVILRGLPGSGKSSLASLLCSGTDGARHVSADHFFEQGAGRLNGRERKGLSADEVYARSFDVGLLGAAHEHCRAAFREAVEAGAALVVVDNTHTTRREYSHYVQRATAAGFNVAVVEVRRASATRAGMEGESTMRGKHAVPAAVAGKMAACWEKDDSSVLLHAWEPSRESAVKEKKLRVVDAPGEDDSDVGSSDEDDVSAPVAPRHHGGLNKGGCGLAHFFELHKGLAHTSKAAPRTHLSMEVGGSKLHFLRIPEKLLEAFHAACAADDDANTHGERGSAAPRFLCEYALSESDSGGGRSPTGRFRLFFDVDCHADAAALDWAKAAAEPALAVVEQGGIAGAASVVHAVVSAIPTALATCGITQEDLGRAIVVGTADGDGFHVKLPSVEVTVAEARACRDALVRTLAFGTSGGVCGASVDWPRVIDDSVYTHLTCRMVGSRKTTKGVDVGRVYGLLAVFSLHQRWKDHAPAQVRRWPEAEDEYRNNGALLLADSSITIPRST